MPTYNFAVVVDDLDMAITHVVRGDDHVNNTPRQINIYQALKAQVPQFAHLPTILGSDGEKLSKRHGAVSLMQYPADGYLPEALFNYLARLGWSHGDAEKFPRDKFIEWFDLAQVSRSPAQFDQAKLTWLNHEYIKEADNARLAKLVAPLIEQRGGTLAGGPDLAATVGLVKDRAHTLQEIAQAALLFYANTKAEPALLAQHLTDAIKPALASPCKDKLAVGRVGEGRRSARRSRKPWHSTRSRCPSWRCRCGCWSPARRRHRRWTRYWSCSAASGSSPR